MFKRASALSLPHLGGLVHGCEATAEVELACSSYPYFPSCYLFADLGGEHHRHRAFCTAWSVARAVAVCAYLRFALYTSILFPSLLYMDGPYIHPMHLYSSTREVSTTKGQG